MLLGRHPVRIQNVVSWPLALGWLVAGCSGGDLVLPRDGAANAIRVVEGDGQTGAVGQPLTEPVVIEVTNTAGEPVEGATVEFALTSAGEGAEVAPATATTSAQGRAEAHVVLGDKVGLQTGQALLLRQGSASLSATFSAVALADDNRRPNADFEWQCDALDCQFSDASSDDDGSVVEWAWDFGDGAASADRDPSHRYEASGTYAVTLRVTDDKGGLDESTEQVTATAPSTPPSTPPSNASPDADFGVDCDDLRCTFTDRSADRDGSVVQWQWSFGDGATSSQRSPSHTYAASGRYDVRLVVTDDDGSENRRTRTARPEEPPPETPPPPPEEPPPPPEEPPPPPEEPPPPPPEPNKPPRAEFEVQCQELRCVFADRSGDEDGGVVSWRWDFGDGATSSERNPSHSYAAPGRYDVLLVVTDDDGAATARAIGRSRRGRSPTGRRMPTSRCTAAAG